MDFNEKKKRMDFPRMCRELRIAKGWSLSVMSQRTNIKSYQNVEYNNHKTVRVERVHAIAAVHGLNESDTARLVAAWEALPVSEYSERQRKKWKERNAARSKSRGYDAMRKALLEIFGELVMLAFSTNTELKCDCGPSGASERDPTRSCELCNALQVLGLPRWTDTETAVTGLANLQEKLDAKQT